ncbi:MAG TPA: hypothetical protein V6D22_13955 [Candidatus Obscuribacterales bacterium]
MSFWKAEVPPPSKASEDLTNAVVQDDAAAAAKLLESAGGACAARKVAAEAKNQHYWSLGYSVDFDGNQETLAVYRLDREGSHRVAGIKQPRCKE